MLKIYSKSTLSFQNSLRFFSEKLKIKKDYYQILGIPKSASENEIKTAYRNMAKMYHPDVNVGVESHEPNVDKFRDIAEAYAVLSNKTLRLDYDMRMRQFPDIIYNAEKMKNMEESKPNRNGAGNQIKPGPLKGSYAEYRMEKLKEWRQKFNVDNNGFYKGGVPRKNNGPVRGDAWGAPGMFHNPWHHNENVHDNPHARPQVTLKESQEHKAFMNVKRNNYERFKPYYKMDEVEQDSQYYVDSEHRVLFWIPCLIILSVSTYYIYQRFLSYKRFNHFEKQLENLKAFEFVREGPILLHAPDFKYMEKFLTREQYSKWIDNDLRSFG